MDKFQRKIRRSPSLKRRSKVVPIGQRLILERVLGLTVSSNAAFTCDPVSGVIAYPAGCVVVLFNPRRNRQSHIFNVSKKTITSVAFSADGKHLVTGECGHQPAVRVWDVEEKTQVTEFHGHKFGINCVAFSPNLKYIVSIGSQHDMVVNVWNWRTGNKIASNKVSCKVSSVAFGSDSSFFVTVGNRHVKFWYLDSSQSKINQTVPLLGHSGILGEHKNNYFCDVACGRGKTSGSTFVITQSGMLCAFDDKRLLDKWVDLKAKNASCITAGEEHIYIGCAEGVVRVFSADNFQFVANLPYPHHLGVDVATATSSRDLICTETDAKYPDVIAITLDDHHKKVACVYNDHSLYVWDVMNLRHVGKAWSFLFHSGCVWALEVYPRLENGQTGALPPGSFVTASTDNTIRVWNLDPRVSQTPGYKHNVYSTELLKVVYTDPSHSFLCDVDYNPAGGIDKTDMTWDGKNGVRSIRISPDGQHLASGDRQGNIRIYDLHQMSEIRLIEAHESDVVCLEYLFSKAGPKILASGGRDRLIHVFDVEQHYGLVQTLDDHSATIQSVRFTDANNRLRMLSCGSDKSLLFRNATSETGFQFSLDQHLVSKSTMYDMIIDPTHKFVATACQDRNIRIYNMKTAKQRKNYRASLGDEGTLLRVQLDPSGTYAATSCTDKNVCVLDFYTGELTATVYGHSEIVTGLHFTNDLKHLISVSADGCIFVWRVSSEMTKTMRVRMEQLGKMPKKEAPVLDTSREARLVPSPMLLDTTYTTSSSAFPVIKESISPSSILSTMDLHLSSGSQHPFSYPETPVRKRVDSSSPQPLPAHQQLFVGPLPSWAKAKLDDTCDGADHSMDTAQPKGRWAQRFDQNLAFKSQLDLSQIEEGDMDSRRLTGLEGGGLQNGMLTSSMPDLRRETVVLPHQHLSAKNIPIIDDDDETNVDDDEDFFPAYMKDELPENENECSSSEVDRRRTQNGDSLGGRSDRVGFRRFSNQTSIDGEDMTQSTDFEDLEDSDVLPDATRIIYPPSKPDIVDPCNSTYQVFAADEVKKKARRRTSSTHTEEGDEPAQSVSVEENTDVHDEATVTSSSGSQSKTDCPVLPPDKEQFVKENFESVSFTPVAMDKFVQQVASLEQAVDVSSEQTGLPFSPRLSLSSRFLSHSHFVGVRSGARLGTRRNVDNHLNPVPKSQSVLAHSMEDTRRRLASMNWRTGGLIQESPEKDDPHSPPTKLENKEPSFSTPVSSSHGNLGAFGSASPRTLPHTWADLTLSHQSIKEEHPLPRIPVPHALTVLKEKAVHMSESIVSSKNNLSVRNMTVDGVQNSGRESLTPLVQKQLSSSRLSRKTPQLLGSVDRTFVRISNKNRSPSPCCTETLEVDVSLCPQSPQLDRSLCANSDHLLQSSQDLTQSHETATFSRSPQSSLSPCVKSQGFTLSYQTPSTISSPGLPKTPLSECVSKLKLSAHHSDTPESYTSGLSLKRDGSLGMSGDSCSPTPSQEAAKVPGPRVELENCSSIDSSATSSTGNTSELSSLENDNSCREKTTVANSSSSKKSSDPQTERSRSTSPQTERARSTSPQTERSRSASPQTERARSTSPQTERSRSTSPQTERGRSTSPQAERARSTSPQTERARSTSPQTERGRSTSPQTERSRSTSPQTERSRRTSPQAERARSTSPQTERARSTSPQTERARSTSPQTERSRSTSPQTERSRSTSPQAERSSTSPQTERSRSTSPQTERARSTSPQAERSRSTSPQAERSRSTSPQAERSSTSPQTERSRSTSPQAERSSTSPQTERSRSTSPQTERSRSTSPQAERSSTSPQTERARSTSPQTERARSTSPHTERARSTSPPSPYLGYGRDENLQFPHVQFEKRSCPQSSPMESEKRFCNQSNFLPDENNTCSDGSLEGTEHDPSVQLSDLQPKKTTCLESAQLPFERCRSAKCSNSQPDRYESTYSLALRLEFTTSAFEKCKNPQLSQMQPEQHESAQSPDSIPLTSLSAACSQSAGSQVGESVLAACHALSHQPEHVGIEMAEAGEKLEKENSPIHSVPARNAPCATHRAASKPSHKTAPASGKGKRLSTDGAHSHGAKGPRSSSVPPSPRQAPSYCRTTQSSRLKSASASNLLKQVENQHGTAASAAVSGEKTKGVGKTRKGRLLPSGQGRHKSTPNLISCNEMEKNAAEQVVLEENSTSNLCGLANLSFSDSDIVSVENATTSVDNFSASVSTVPCRDQKIAPKSLHAKGTRRRGQSLPSENTAPQKYPHGQDGEVTDTVLMPFPAGTSCTQRSLLQRAAQVSKGSASSLTLEQAKSILLGNSGILEVPQISVDGVSATSDGTSAPVSDRIEKTQNRTRSHVLYKHSETLSSTSTTRSSPVSLHSVSPPSIVNSSPMVYNTTTISDQDSACVSCTTETVHTGSRHSLDRNLVSFVDVTRFDIPEHDKPKPQNAQSCAGSLDCLFHDKPKPDTDDGLSDVFDAGQETMSVLDEMARLNNSLQRDSLGAGVDSAHAQACHDSCRMFGSGHRDSALLTEQMLLDLNTPSGHLPSDYFESSRYSPSLQGQTLSPIGQALLSCAHLPQGKTVSLCNQISQQIGSTCSQSPQEQTLLSCSQSPREQICGQSPHGNTSSSCSLSPEQNVSPRSQSDTGLGSDTDTDCDTLHSPLSQQVDEEKMSSPLAVNKNQELMTKCSNIVDELKTAVQRTKDFCSEMNQHKVDDPSHQQMMNRLSDTIHQAHLTLAELALHTPVSAHTIAQPHFCPLTGETGGGVEWDSAVLEQARSMLRPFMWNLSRELSQEVVKVVQEQLEEGSTR